MPHARPPRPPYPPAGGSPAESDEALAAGVRGGTDAEVAEATALLTARHWRPVYDYAVICLATSGQLAAMATSNAFHLVLDRLKLGEPGGDLRPRLLLAARETIRLWAATDRIADVLPELRKPAGARGMRAAKSMTSDSRVLAERAYHGLPAVERCLIWHTQVEAEPVTVPAALLGMDAATAASILEGARDRFREGMVRAHRELAPDTECRHYNRLLDVPLRRGTDLLADVRRHMDDCRYCRSAAAQLGLFDNAPGLLIAEAVLGWGARRYLETRPGRADQPTGRLRGNSRGNSRGGGGGSGRRLLDRIPGPRRGSGGLRRAGRGEGEESGTFASGQGVSGSGGVSGPGMSGTGAVSGQGVFGTGFVPGQAVSGTGFVPGVGASGAGVGSPPGASGAPFAPGEFAASRGGWEPDAFAEDSGGGGSRRAGKSRSRRAAGKSRMRLVVGRARSLRGGRGSRALRKGGSGLPSKGLVTGVGLASAGLLTTFLAAGLWSGDGTDPAASTGSRGSLPGADPGYPTTPSTATQGDAGLPTGPRQTRLRNAAADLCLDIPVGARAGTSLVLNVCSSDWSQQWSYEDDGQLRSVAEPALCVDSRSTTGVVIANPCAAQGTPRADDVRYDLTVQGELLPRWDPRLPLAAAGRDPGAEVAVKLRDGSAEQRWLTDRTTTSPGSLSSRAGDAGAGGSA